MKERFEVIYKEVHSAGLEKRIIYVDKETGVNYLYVQNGYSGAAGWRRFLREPPSGMPFLLQKAAWFS
ncbi:MAG: DUF6440 family protein [Clostridiales bacterium]|nr:DUF6440 family protein [Clostridiales bacterium]